TCLSLRKAPRATTNLIEATDREFRSSIFTRAIASYEVPGVMTNLERRLARIEVRFGSIIDAAQKVADPFSPESILLRLLDGEWQCALKLLERQQCDRCRAWRPGPRELLDTPFADLSRLRQILDRSLGSLSEELRHGIAQRLLEADGCGS